MSRPSVYSEEVAACICTRLIEGETMLAICQDEKMPARATVYGWMEADDAFRARCTRAREEQAEYMDDLILTIANACTPETAFADKVKISAYQWRASKLKPRRYGDKLELSGDAEQPVEIVVRYAK